MKMMKAKEALKIHEEYWGDFIAGLKQNNKRLSVAGLKSACARRRKENYFCNCIGCASTPKNRLSVLECRVCILNLGCCEVFLTMRYGALDKLALIKSAKKIRDCGLRKEINPEQMVALREIGD